MKLAGIFGVTLLACLMGLYEWPKMNKNQKKEKWVFAGFTLLSWGLAVLLIFFPDLPGPTQAIDALFKPLGQLLE